MNDKRQQRSQGAGHGVPVEDAVLHTHPPVGPKRLEEVALGVERNTPYNIAQPRSEEEGQQDARQSEDDVEKAPPQFVLDSTTKFNADAAEHQQPQHYH